MSTYETSRGPVQYPDKFDMTAMMGGDVSREYQAGTWLHINPHRLDLGRIGLLLRPEAGAPGETDPAVLTDPRQRWWGLEIAQRWRERLGLERHEHWQHIQDHLALPRQEKGVYSAIATEPYLRRDDHPSMLCALGVVPEAPLIDPAVMEATLLDVRDHWDWNSAWGWDFPVMAMTATRLGRPDLAVDALLTDTAKNTYLATGHSPQIGSILPLYLPANGALLTAVSLMVAGWESADTDECPGFPGDGSWTVQHEGFQAWP
ncbi:hypothetical protein AB0L53_48945 [Nonomuraea sp. NPDC052129]|uniref:hypothetical protein n=1 Tax=Nonomuraea sp. NPDC052129 TaxID=3154651 RepID=UPI00341B3888